ncbi:AraC family transcriptional regulator [Paenibacillus monticola]|uniref:Helix-turn-helix domain-containing protein n=1 Tax=Paenibacillus monticola TaxID=2666075 RepID=A0A7X2H8C8_9BACL|nr:AraC family transcriptional regulator [Paenibacillus monticola]MRN54693.1 helix-turn-helix domain-containing protein [Paenibacillus monticola]
MEIIRTENKLREKVLFSRHYPIYLGDTIGVTSHYQRLHSHDALEINMIKSGTGYYMINGERYDFKEGDILLINSNDLHCAYETDNLVMQVITFDPSWFIGSLRCDPDILCPFKEMGVYFNNLLDRNHPKIESLRSLLLLVQEEHEAERRSYTSIVYAHLLQFLVYVNRFFRLNNPKTNKSTIPAPQLEKMRIVTEIMEIRFAYPWTLEELAALIYLSPSRFSDIFRRTVGMSPLMYLIHLRLENAYTLLESSDRKIVDISMDCGFRSLSNFNRLFKRHIGTEPRNIRSKANTSCSKIVLVIERLSGEIEVE